MRVTKDYRRIAAMVASGMTYRQISRDTGYPVSSISYALRSRGAAMAPQQRVDRVRDALARRWANADFRRKHLEASRARHVVKWDADMDAALLRLRRLGWGMYRISLEIGVCVENVAQRLDHFGLSRMSPRSRAAR